MSLIDDIKRDREAGTPDHGGWMWSGGRDDVMLVTRQGGRRYVMGFRRKGMRSAQPTFQTGGIMEGAIDRLTTYEVGDGSARGQKQADADPTVYRMDVDGIDHPDARRIARIPEMEAALLAAGELAEALREVAAAPEPPEYGLTDFGEREHYKWQAVRRADAARVALTAFQKALK